MDNIEQKDSVSSLSEGAEKAKEIKISLKISSKTAIIAGVVIAVGVLAYFGKGLFIAATVNGSPISRLALIDKLEKTSGKQTLEGLITQRLVISQLDKENIKITPDEINAEIKRIEDQVSQQGNTLDQALEAQGMTRADLREQVSVNLRLGKLLSDQTQVTDAEVAQYIKDNKLTITRGQETQFKDQIKNQIKSGKLSKAAQEWISTIRAAASINYFVKY